MAAIFVAVGLEAPVPMVERLGVVEAQELEIGHPQLVLLDDREDLRQGRGIGAGEDVLAQPRACGAGRAHLADGMQHHQPVIVEQRVDLGEELAVMMHAHMLEHADRHDAVELSVHLAVIEQLEAHAIRQACAPRLLVGERVLLLRERDAGDVHVLHGREIEREVAPAAADVEDSSCRA